MFAVKEGVSAGSLFRWARLHRSMASSSRAVELVEAVPLETTEPGSWAWEVELPRGTLRGRDNLGDDRVHAIIAAVLRPSR